MKITKKERKAQKQLAIQRKTVDKLADAAISATANGDIEPFIFPIKHHFSDRIYCREFFMPAGTYGSGIEHKISNYFVLAYGVLSVICGDSTKTIEAPCLCRNEPGQKNGAYAITDCLMYQFTPNPTNSTDLYTVYSEITDYPEEIQGMPKNKQEQAFKEYLLCHS